MIDIITSAYRKPSILPFPGAFLGGKEKEGGEGKGNGRHCRWQCGVEGRLINEGRSERIHTSGVQRKWLLLSEPWDLVNVFSLPEIKCCRLEWMTVFSSIYPSKTVKVCVDTPCQCVETGLVFWRS